MVISMKICEISDPQVKEEILNYVHDVFLCREYNLEKQMICSLILGRKESVGFPENTYITGQIVVISGGQGVK